MIWTIVYSLGAVQAAFLLVILAINEHRRDISNRYLSGLLMVILLILSLFSLRTIHANNLHPWFFWIVVSTPMLIGPLLYLYIKDMIEPRQYQPHRHMLHFLPFLVLVLFFFDELTTPISAGLSHLDSAETLQKITVAGYIKSGSILVYLVASWLLLHNLSDQRQTKSLYYKVTKLAISAFIIVAILGSIQSTLVWTGMTKRMYADQLELTYLTLFVFLLVFLEFKKEGFLKVKIPKYQKTQLTSDVRLILQQQLLELFEQHQIFIEPDYSPVLVAKKLGITEHQLSEVIALECGSNFHHLSNQYRFKMFTKLIQQNPSANLLELAFDAGFKSKSSFNRAIKHLTQLTPSQYKASLSNLNPN
jgi:AraC-like DNA-binding protein